MSKCWEVYIILTESGKLYTGITNHFERRFSEHAQGKKGAAFFRFSKPKAVVFREACANRSEATKRELAIKKMSRKEKWTLIQHGKDHPSRV